MKKHLLLLLSVLLIADWAVGNTPYINRVYAYVPAPGQFIGKAYPNYSEGESEATVLERVNDLLCGKPDVSRMVCLGAWGGYVTFGFDHPIINVPGEYDLRVHGNAFVNPPIDGVQYGSCEPGIVYVSEDINGDGLPNDPWYELAGSEFERTVRDYEVTYFSDEMDVPWEDNRGNVDFIYRMSPHKQRSYYPMWRTDEEYTLSGSLLPSNINPDNQQSYPYAYGYVDVWPNQDERSALKLDWAVDSDGQPANLTQIHFVRVQTGVMQPHWGAGGLNGEMSTEITGAEDLHPDATALPHTSLIPTARRILTPSGEIRIICGEQIYNLLGRQVANL